MTGPVSMPHNHRQAECPFRPGPALVELHEDPSLHRVPVPNSQLGEVGAVLITREEDAPTVLSDARHEVGFAFDPHWTGPRSVMNQPGVLLNYDGDEHTRYRQMQAGAFTMKRIRALSGVIEQIVEKHLEAVEEAGPGADLIKTFAEPLPLIVICELLGAPLEDRAGILERSSIASSVDTTLEVQQENFAARIDYMAQLVAAHRWDPGAAVPAPTTNVRGMSRSPGTTGPCPPSAPPPSGCWPRFAAPRSTGRCCASSGGSGSARQTCSGPRWWSRSPAGSPAPQALTSDSVYFAAGVRGRTPGPTRPARHGCTGALIANSRLRRAEPLTDNFK
ncbi:hypothetical protein [Streptomyces sp. NPDC001020]